MLPDRSRDRESPLNFNIVKVILVETTGQVFYELKAEPGEGGTSSQRGEIKQQGYLDLAENSFEVISHHLN